MSLAAIDIANYQGTPNMTAVRGAGIALVFIKATQGTGYVNPTFAVNRANATAAGLVRGFYHFAGGEDPTSEANHFCDTVGSLAAGDLVALDWEIANPNPVTWCQVFLTVVKNRLGVQPGIYLNKSTESGLNWGPVVALGTWLWLADYDFAPAVVPNTVHWPVLALKQYSDRGSVPGVAGGVDCDTFEGDLGALARYGYPVPGPAPAPAPVPVPPPAPPTGFDVRGWRCSYGDTDPHLSSLQAWANRMFPSYRSTPIAPLANHYGDLTARFIAEFGAHVAVPNDGRDIGPRIAANLYTLGWRG